MLKFNQYQKYDKTSSIIFADFKSLIKKVDGCKKDPEKLSKTKLGEHTPCEYSMPMIWTFDGIETKHVVYRGVYYIKKFWESLRDQAMKIFNFEKRKLYQ